jgi:hypothetical protein
VDSVEDVIRAIEAAFAGVRRGQTTLHEAEAMDSYASVEERRKARARDPEEDWRDIPAAAIDECPTALSFFDPVSWRFYLPAFMRLGLQRLRDSPSPMDDVIYTLNQGSAPPSAVEHALERFRTLNGAQAEVVHRFLTFASKNDDDFDALAAKDALDRYWSSIVTAV